MRLVVVDAGIGNLGAIPNMLKRIGAAAEISNERAAIEAADKLILPGVGAFDPAARRLRELDLVDVLDRRVAGGTPVLGLCLGMQLMTDGSEEGALPGLGWIPGRVERFRFDGSDPSLRVPHMGWNFVTAAGDVPLLAGYDGLPRFYFAHSFYVRPSRDEDVAGTTTYGIPFASVLHRENVWGAQFHPEKSHRFGLRFLENFVAL